MSADPDSEKIVRACPHCDSTDIYHRAKRGNAHAGNPDDNFYCHNCRESFNDPVLRAAKHGQAGRLSGPVHGNLAVDGELLDRVRKQMGIVDSQEDA